MHRRRPAVRRPARSLRHSSLAPSSTNQTHTLLELQRLAINSKLAKRLSETAVTPGILRQPGLRGLGHRQLVHNLIPSLQKLNR